MAVHHSAGSCSAPPPSRRWRATGSVAWATIRPLVATTATLGPPVPRSTASTNCSVAGSVDGLGAGFGGSRWAHALTTQTVASRTVSPVVDLESSCRDRRRDPREGRSRWSGPAPPGRWSRTWAPGRRGPPGEVDPVGHLQTGGLAHVLDVTDHLAGQAAPAEVVVEGQVEGHHLGPVPGHGEPGLGLDPQLDFVPDQLDADRRRGPPPPVGRRPVRRRRPSRPRCPWPPAGPGPGPSAGGRAACSWAPARRRARRPARRSPPPRPH